MRSMFYLVFCFGCADGPGSDKAAADDRVDGVPIPTGTSSGYCPDLSISQTTDFESSGSDRIVTVVVPENPTEEMPLVFFYHGLLDPGSTPKPTEYMATALNLQSLADELGVLIVLPQSGTLNRMGFEFFMWDVEGGDNADVVLFDDLRACAYDQHKIDLTRVHSMGFSGGALFSTVIARERGNLLASLVEMSGGSDIDMLTFDAPISKYETPEYAMPSLLISGGPSDQWPGGGVTLVDFSEATNTLADNLSADGHLVVQCEHSRGHTVPMQAFNAAQEWIAMHKFGAASPIEGSGLSGMDNFEDWCEIVD